MFCSNCGAQIDDDSKVCKFCNSGINRQNNVIQQNMVFNAYDNAPGMVKIPEPEKSKSNVAIIVCSIIIGVALVIIALLLLLFGVAVKDEPTTTEPTETTTEQLPLSDENLFSYAFPSSVLPVDGSFDYYGENLLDNNSSTCWCEGASGNGIGESVKLELNSGHPVQKIEIKSGYCKNQDVYTKNSRPKKISIEFENGKIINAQLEDIYNTYQTIDVSGAEGSSYAVITILEVYSGTVYTDTCISEIAAY